MELTAIQKMMGDAANKILIECQDHYLKLSFGSHPENEVKKILLDLLENECFEIPGKAPKIESISQITILSVLAPFNGTVTAEALGTTFRAMNYTVEVVKQNEYSISLEHRYEFKTYSC